MRALVSSRANGVLLKSKGPYISWLADWFGLRCEKQSMFKVSSTIGEIHPRAEGDRACQWWQGQQ